MITVKKVDVAPAKTGRTLAGPIVPAITFVDTL